MGWPGRDTHFSHSRAAQSEADVIDPQCHRVSAPGWDSPSLHAALAQCSAARDIAALD
jgi:hypothetical protein